MKNKFVFVSLSLFFVTILIGCYNDKEELLYPASVTSCDTNSVISYSTHIVPILSSYCYACHGNANYASMGGNLNLDGYTNFVDATANDLVLKSIKRESGVSPMPKNSPKLSDCNIKVIEKWINQGALDN